MLKPVQGRANFEISTIRQRKFNLPCRLSLQAQPMLDCRRSGLGTPSAAFANFNTISRLVGSGRESMFGIGAPSECAMRLCARDPRHAKPMYAPAMVAYAISRNGTTLPRKPSHQRIAAYMSLLLLSGCRTNLSKIIYICTYVVKLDARLTSCGGVALRSAPGNRRETKAVIGFPQKLLKYGGTTRPRFCAAPELSS